MHMSTLIHIDLSLCFFLTCILFNICVPFGLASREAPTHASCLQAKKAHICVGQSKLFIFLFYVQHNVKKYIPTRPAASERYWATCIISKTKGLFLSFFFHHVCKQPTRTAASDNGRNFVLLWERHTTQREQHTWKTPCTPSCSWNCHSAAKNNRLYIVR